ncbi:MAG: RsbRD N-terminal domain-containing protein, partial [Armatimonadetes bacterium]|nr:RsbRD N-terminal domain-containing protein [Armatimonadota bacterium]
MPHTLQDLLLRHEQDIAERYVQAMQASSKHYSMTPAEEIERNVHRSLQLLGNLHRAPASEEARAYIRNLCEQRVPQGFRLGEVMNAIFLLGDVVIPLIREESSGDREAERQAEDDLRIGLNRLALLWSEGYYELQEELMARKELAMLQLSTPVTQMWEGILTLPLIGDVDDR